MVHPFAVSWYAGTLHNFGTSTFWPRALDIYDGSRDQPSSLNIDAYSFSSWVMTFAIEYFWKYIYTQQLRLRFIRNPAIKGCKFTPPQMLETLSLRCTKLPHYVNAREPGERNTISPICVRSGAPAAEQSSFLTFPSSLFSQLRYWGSKVLQTTTWFSVRLSTRTHITPASQT